MQQNPIKNKKKPMAKRNWCTPNFAYTDNLMEMANDASCCRYDVAIYLSVGKKT